MVRLGARCGVCGSCRAGSCWAGWLFCVGYQMLQKIGNTARMTRPAFPLNPPGQVTCWLPAQEIASNSNYHQQHFSPECRASPLPPGLMLLNLLQYLVLLRFFSAKCSHIALPCYSNWTKLRGIANFLRARIPQ